MTITDQAAFGERKGKVLRQYGIKSIETEPEDQDLTTASNSGYSLSAHVWIAHNKRKKLEQLIRYMARGPIAQERLSEAYTGQILYKLKTSWKSEHPRSMTHSDMSTEDLNRAGITESMTRLSVGLESS